MKEKHGTGVKSASVFSLLHMYRVYPALLESRTPAGYNTCKAAF